jgi:hypothetical protein
MVKGGTTASYLPVGQIVNASPDSSAVPGAAQIQHLLGGLMWLSIAGCIAAIVIGAVAIGLGNQAGNPHTATMGKKGVIGGLVGAFLIGSAAAIVGFFFALGGQVSGS